MIIPDGELASPHAATDANFAQLYERHYAAVFAFACRRTGDRARAEDVTAHTFLQALQAYGRYDDRGVPITAWLLRIAGNVVREQARRERRGPRIIPVSVCPPGWDSALRDHPDDWAERLERRAWIAGHLAALAPAARQTAIRDRPSRFDRTYRFDLPAVAERQAYMAQWNASLQPALRVSAPAAARIAERTEVFSFAYLKERFLSAMMRWIATPQPGAMDQVLEEQVDVLRAQMASVAAPSPDDARSAG